eukprot:GFUD01069017.1.p1 GENE.GFUD01069017.1~~GFUD01069017.1.p1  ORF type:complete len:112 (+),score=9.60 GFUD01069017.1:1-336(+)
MGNHKMYAVVFTILQIWFIDKEVLAIEGSAPKVSFSVLNPWHSLRTLIRKPQLYQAERKSQDMKAEQGNNLITKNADCSKYPKSLDYERVFTFNNVLYNIIMFNKNCKLLK